MTEYVDQSGRTESDRQELKVELDGSFLDAPVDATGVDWFVERTPLHDDSESDFEASLTLEGIVSDAAANALEHSYRIGSELQLVSPMSAPPMEVESLEIDDAGQGRTHVTAVLLTEV